MTDHFTTAPRPYHTTGDGEQAMSRLADRLLAMTPQQAAYDRAHEPLAVSPPTQPAMPRPSPAVSAAIERASTISRDAARTAARKSKRSFLGAAIDSFVAACAFIPYAAVALGLRLIMARVFFLDGQTRIEGPHVPLNVYDFNLSVVLPAQVKAETFSAFMTQIPPLPVPPAVAAYLVSYAEFILPAMLVLGLGTRFAAIGLLVMTAVIQVYVLPDALWSTHIYWAAILMVLVSLGAGQVSIDHLIRFIARR